MEGTAVIRIALGIVAGLALLLSAGSALGTQMASATELASSERTRIQRTASAAFPDSRCHDGVNIMWEHDLQALAPDLASKGKEIAGFAYGYFDGSCDVGIRSDLEPNLACTTALHEAGHLAGLEHGSSVLMGDSEGDFHAYRDPRCATMTRLDRMDAYDALWLNKQVTPKSKVACRRVSPTEFSCTSTRGLVRKFWQVRQVGERTVARITGAIA